MTTNHVESVDLDAQPDDVIVVSRAELQRAMTEAMDQATRAKATKSTIQRQKGLKPLAVLRASAWREIAPAAKRSSLDIERAVNRMFPENASKSKRPRG